MHHRVDAAGCPFIQASEFRVSHEMAIMAVWWPAVESTDAVFRFRIGPVMAQSVRRHDEFRAGRVIARFADSEPGE
jgi:hypothetical protein